MTLTYYGMLLGAPFAALKDLEDGKGTKQFLVRWASSPEKDPKGLGVLGFARLKKGA